MARAAFRRAAGSAVLLTAAADGDIAAIQDFLKTRKQDINDTDDSGMNALLYALENDHEDAAALLLHHGADPDYAAGASKTTPLMIACENMMSGAVERLLLKGAQMDAQETTTGDTALMKAIRAKHAWAACRLISAGAAMENTNRKGETAETLARQHLSREDVGFVSAAILHRREEAAAAQAEVHDRTVTENCVLQRDIAPLKVITLRPRTPK
ncbi:MAG: ankyrin repeat domain-containing protein [Alphaproteobacteria bacterium]|nr:ankyrin repeat domain-containing protein [Alphaproteobacteria bacterium]